jgi:hypothetical protein
MNLKPHCTAHREELEELKLEIASYFDLASFP